MADDVSTMELARARLQTAGEGFMDAARYFGSLPESAWHDPTGTDWDMRMLADHIAGEAIWFPNVVRGVTRGEPPIPAERYEELKAWPAARLVEEMERSANELSGVVDDATDAHLKQNVDMGFAQISLWQATYICLVEGVFHDWDTHAGREPDATIPTRWACELARGMDWFGPQIARQEPAAAAPGPYSLQVGDDVGPITVRADNGSVVIESGRSGSPAVTLHLTADQYVRLIAGRLDLPRAIERGEVRVDGPKDAALPLRRIFAGIGNGP